MKRVVISIVAMALVLSGSLLLIIEPTQARFGFRSEGFSEDFGGAWNTVMPYHNYHWYGVDADVYPWYQSPTGWVASDIACTFTFEFSWWFPIGVGSFISANHTQYTPSKVLRYVRYRASSDTDEWPGWEYKGVVPQYTWQEYTILRFGSEWWVFMNGGQEYKFPSIYSKCSIKADCSTWMDFGDARSYFWNVRELNDSWQWEDSNLLADNPSLHIKTTVWNGNNVYTVDAP